MRTLDDPHYIHGFAALPDTFHSRLRPAPLAAPHVVSLSPGAAGLLDLDATALRHLRTTAALTGTDLPVRADTLADTLAAIYAGHRFGHQFGHWVPQVGDGIRVLLGEVANTRGGSWEVQPRGPARSPVSTTGMGVPCCAPASASTCAPMPCTP